MLEATSGYVNLQNSGNFCAKLLTRLEVLASALANDYSFERSIAITSSGVITPVS